MPAPSSPTATYCPATPRPLLELGPLSRNATPEETTAHDEKTAETARYKLGKITADDEDGYHRVMCPAAMGKLRCPLRPASMTLDYQRPEILAPPRHAPACCAQQTITVPPGVHAKTAQKHDYPSKAHRRSYTRRSAAERTFSTVKDTATNDISRGWCRLMGLTPIALFAACLLITRNQRILAAFDARQDQDTRRAAAGLPPKPAAVGARHSPASPPRRHNRGSNPRARSHLAALITITASPHGPGIGPARQLTPPAGKTTTTSTTSNQIKPTPRMSDPNVNIKRGQT